MFESEFERCFNLQATNIKKKEKYVSATFQFILKLHKPYAFAKNNTCLITIDGNISQQLVVSECSENREKKPQDCNLCDVRCAVINSLMQFDCCDHQVVKLISIDKLHTTNGYGLMNRARDAY